MYLYYDKYRVLKEIINDVALIQHNDQANVVYVYYELEDTLSGMYLVVEQNDGTTLQDREMSRVNNATEKEIPYDENRELKYFKYGVEYNFFKYTLINEDLSVAGLIKLTPFAVPTLVGSYSLGTFVGNVVANKVAPTELMTESEYQDLVVSLARKLDITTASETYLSQASASEIYATKEDLANKQPVIATYTSVQQSTNPNTNLPIYQFSGFSISENDNIDYFCLKIRSDEYWYFSKNGHNHFITTPLFTTLGHFICYEGSITGTTFIINETIVDEVDYKVANNPSNKWNFGDLDNLIGTQITTMPDNFNGNYIELGNSIRIKFAINHVSFSPTIHYSSQETITAFGKIYTYEATVSNRQLDKTYTFIAHFAYQTSSQTWTVRFVGLTAIYDDLS